MKPTSKDQIPDRKHFAALVFTSQSIYHEGDERSRTHPGHGYPAHTEVIKSIDYISFTTLKEMEEWVVEAERKKTEYRLIEAQPLYAKVTAAVSIKT